MWLRDRAYYASSSSIRRGPIKATGHLSININSNEDGGANSGDSVIVRSSRKTTSTPRSLRGGKEEIEFELPALRSSVWEHICHRQLSKITLVTEGEVERVEGSGGRTAVEA